MPFRFVRGPRYTAESIGVWGRPADANQRRIVVFGPKHSLRPSQRERDHHQMLGSFGRQAS
jgi:hypothetical protein